MQRATADIPDRASGTRPIVIQLMRQPTVGCCSTKIALNNSKAVAIAAGFQLALGGLSIVTSIGAILVGASVFNYTGYGLWSPVIWIIAGSFGLASSRSKTQGMIITTMVMSILSAVTIVYYLILASFDVAFESDDWRKYNGDYGDYSSKKLNPRWHIRMALNSTMIVVAVAEGIVAIIASVLCCKVCCCGAATDTESHDLRYLTVNTDTQDVAISTASGSAPIVTSTAPVTETSKATPAEGMNFAAHDVTTANLPPPYNAIPDTMSR